MSEQKQLTLVICERQRQPHPMQWEDEGAGHKWSCVDPRRVELAEPPSARAMRAASKVLLRLGYAHKHETIVKTGYNPPVTLSDIAGIIDAAMAEPAAPPKDPGMLAETLKEVDANADDREWLLANCKLFAEQRAEVVRTNRALAMTPAVPPALRGWTYEIATWGPHREESLIDFLNRWRMGRSELVCIGMEQIAHDLDRKPIGPVWNFIFKTQVQLEDAVPPQGRCPNPNCSGGQIFGGDSQGLYVLQCQWEGHGELVLEPPAPQGERLGTCAFAFHDQVKGHTKHRSCTRWAPLPPAPQEQR